MKKNLEFIFQEPYRFFFPLGILMGAIGVGHWLMYSIGWLKTYSSEFHSSIQMETYMACFVIGFLLTAMPRFAQANHATKREFFLFAFLMIGIPIFHILSLTR